MADQSPGIEVLHLLDDFPPVPTEAWEAAIQKDLKGADYEKSLVWRTEAGIPVRPYYRRQDIAGFAAQTDTVPGQFPFVRGAGKAWQIRAGMAAAPRSDPRRFPA